MLVISNHQMKVLERAVRSPRTGTLVREVVSAIRRIAPHVSEAELAPVIARGVDKACRYGLHEEDSLGDYLMLSVIAGADFDLHPLVQLQMSRSDLSPELRLRLLLELTSPSDWAAICESTIGLPFFGEFRDVQEIGYPVLSFAGLARLRETRPATP